MNKIPARLFVALQYLLPRFWLTALIWKIARIRHVAFKNFLITRFIQLYRVDTSEIKGKAPVDFASFNDFFVRELEPGARPIAAGPVVSPVDGTVSAAGALRANEIFQAKGMYYTLEDLLATNLHHASELEGGQFATIYLAPYNYHRVHAPFDGEIEALQYVPGELFSVNAATVATVRGLFRRNERLVLEFKTGFGRAVVILVGALNVGSISTPWTGEIRPRRKGVVESLTVADEHKAVRRGDVLGWFNMGSTVIVLLPPGAGEWHDSLVPGAIVRMGQAIAGLPEAE